MSQPVLKGWLSTSIRRNRLSFINACFVLMLCWGGLTFLFNFLVGALFTFEANPAIFILTIFFIPLSLSAIAGALLTAQRFRDFNWSGWWGAFICFAPILFVFSLVLPIDANFLGENISFFGGLFFLIFIFWFIVLVLLFYKPGTKGPNKYGPDPLSLKPARN